MSLQISMTEKQKKYSKDLLIKARASFEVDGSRYSFASTIIRILEEWSKNKGFIKITVQGQKDVTARNLILNDYEEMEYVNNIIKASETTPNPSNLRILGEYIRRVDSLWKYPKGANATKEVIRKAKDLFINEESEEMTLEQSIDIIEELDPDWDWKHEKGEVIREYAKKLRG